MPIYLFRCTGCDEQTELLLGLGDLGDRPCEACGSPTKHRFARIAVKYNGWGFGATDRLVDDPHGKDFTKLRDTAEQIADS
jgi:putative FmdB family regulatory protein